MKFLLRKTRKRKKERSKEFQNSNACFVKLKGINMAAWRIRTVLDTSAKDSIYHPNGPSISTWLIIIQNKAHFIHVMLIPSMVRMQQ